MSLWNVCIPARYETANFTIKVIKVESKVSRAYMRSRRKVNINMSLRLLYNFLLQVESEVLMLVVVKSLGFRNVSRIYVRFEIFTAVTTKNAIS
jgi:hypothetical protein